MSDGQNSDNCGHGAMWELPPIPHIEELHDVFEPHTDDDMTLAMRFAVWAMGRASRVMDDDHHHEVVFVLAKDEEHIEALCESEINKSLEDADKAPLTQLLSKMQPNFRKDIMAGVVRAAVQALEPRVVAHVAEAMMTSVRADGLDKEECQRAIDEISTGKRDIAGMPGYTKEEVLIVRAEVKSGACVMLRRIINRGPDGEYMGLGRVECMVEEADRMTPTGERGQARFSGFWPKPEDQPKDGEVVKVSVNKAISNAMWKF